MSEVPRVREPRSGVTDESAATGATVSQGIATYQIS